MAILQESEGATVNKWKAGAETTLVSSYFTLLPSVLALISVSENHAQSNPTLLTKYRAKTLNALF